jgi:hypothetical protein
MEVLCFQGNLNITVLWERLPSKDGRKQMNKEEAQDVFKSGQVPKESWRLVEQTLRAGRIKERPEQNRPTFGHQQNTPSRSMQKME